MKQFLKLKRNMKPFKMKKGSGEFRFKGGKRSPVAGGTALAVKSILAAPKKNHAVQKRG